MFREITSIFQLATAGRDIGRLIHEFEMQEDGVRSRADLEAFLRREPQFDANGLIRYLITSGWAVELATGVSRPHGDLDIILMDKTDRREKDRISGTYGVDALTAKKNWGGMESSNVFLLANAIAAKFGKKDSELYVVHPATILAQKLGHYDPRLREEDLKDVDTILNYLAKLPDKEIFYNIFYETLLRMPEVSGLQVRDRLEAMQKRHGGSLKTILL